MSTQQLLAQDLPRILRKDQTETTETIAKYLALASTVPDQGLKQSLSEVVTALAQCRNALDTATMVLQGATAPTPMGPGVEAEGGSPATPEQPAVLQEPGLPEGATLVRAPALVADALVATGVLRSSARAKQAIRAGVVKLGGRVIASPDAVVDVGTHELTCDSLTRTIVVR
jgi:hypothetical protein